MAGKQLQAPLTPATCPLPPSRRGTTSTTTEVTLVYQSYCKRAQCSGPPGTGSGLGAQSSYQSSLDSPREGRRYLHEPNVPPFWWPGPDVWKGLSLSLGAQSSAWGWAP